MYDYFDSRLTISKVFNGNDTRDKHSRLRYPTPNGEGYSLGEDFRGMERRSVFARQIIPPLVFVTRRF